MEGSPIRLIDVREIADVSRRVVDQFQHDFASTLARADIHHIGATSLPFGHTKGDVDVNVRVDRSHFSITVIALGKRLTPAQPENWSDSFASFAAEGYELPLGVQITSIGSKDDFLLTLRNRMLADPSLLQRYDDIKVATASQGAEAYWRRRTSYSAKF